MLDSLPSEVITGAVSAIAGAYMRYKAQEQANMSSMVDLALKRTQGKDDSADSAAKRVTDSFSRRFIVLCVVAVAFLGLVLASWSDGVSVSYLYEVPIKEYLFGLWTSGGGVETVTADGFVLPPYVSHSVISIIFFHFGVGAMKVRKY